MLVFAKCPYYNVAIGISTVSKLILFEKGKRVSNLDEIKVSKELKNIYDEIFKALCCDSKTATDMVNIWLRFVLKPEYEVKNIHLYLPDEEYSQRTW